MSSMGLKNSDFKSGLDVKSGVVKSSKINIRKPVKIWDQINLAVKSLNQVTKLR